MPDRPFQPTIQRPVRADARPTRSVVICWPADAPGLNAALGLLLPEASRLGVEVVLATAQGHDGSTQETPTVRAPVDPADDATALRRAGFACAEGDVVALVDPRTPLFGGWLAAWFSRAPGGPPNQIDA